MVEVMNGPTYYSMELFAASKGCKGQTPD